MAGVLKKFLPAYRYGLSATPSDSQPETANSTFKKGAVVIATSGYITEGGTNPTAIVGVADSPAANNGSNGGALTRFTPALDDIVFEGTLDDGSLTYALLATDLFASYGVTKDSSTGFWFIDQSKTSGNARVVIVGLKDAVGTVCARVYFCFKRANTVLV